MPQVLCLLMPGMCPWPLRPGTRLLELPLQLRGMLEFSLLRLLPWLRTQRCRRMRGVCLRMQPLFGRQHHGMLGLQRGLLPEQQQPVLAMPLKLLVLRIVDSMPKMQALDRVERRLQDVYTNMLKALRLVPIQRRPIAVLAMPGWLQSGQ